MSDSAGTERSRESLEILSLAQAQYQAAGTIYGSNNPAEILDALVSFVETVYEEAELGLIDPETDPPILSILAEYTDGRVTRSRKRVRLDEYPAYDTYSAIEVLNISNVETDPFITPEERDGLRALNVASLLVVPLVVTQRLIGVLRFTSAQPVNLGPSRLRALRNLVDQAAVVFENQSLLRDTEMTLQEVRALYDVNQAMLAAVDTMDILRVLRQKLAPDADTILHVVAVDAPAVPTDADAAPMRFLLRQITTRGYESDVQQPISLNASGQPFDSDGSTATNITLVDDAGRVTAQTRHPLHETLVAYGIASYAVMNIRERGAIQDYIAITFKNPFTFDSRTARLYAAVADQTAIVLQNQRLLGEAQMSAAQANNQLRTLQILNNLSTSIAAIKAEDELLNRGLRLVIETLGADHGGLMLMDPAFSVGTVVAEYPALGTLGQEIPVATNPMAQMMREDPYRSLVLADVETDSRIPEQLRQFLVNHAGIRGMVILPLQATDTLIGSIGLDMYEKGRTFTDDQLQTAITMAAQIAIALQNVRLLNDSNRRAAQLQRVAEFGQSLQASLQQEEILDLMAGFTMQMLAVDTLVIGLYDPLRGALRIVTQRRSASDTQPISSTIPLSGTLPGRAWDTGQTVVVGDLLNERGLPALPHSPLNTRSALIVPIMSRSQPTGLVIATSSQANVYNPTDVAIFEQMVTQLNVALENSQAFRKSQQTAQYEALINVISAQLQQYTALDDMLQVTLRELGKALGARRARARFSTPSPSSVSE
ncbi:MAG: GAF domain-containing protein [bacterium]|nr:GAF domain-containing protein [bacterium]